ncbi:MAG: ribosome silencing factor [Flavobacteriales bacterium]|jgi:ribosome-associated protein|nr:ribosome silencing factor [Flavobacteriales bacterium]
MSVNNEASSVLLKEEVIKGMQELKAKNIVCIDLRGIPGAVSDFFVVCHGDSHTQVESISKSIYDVVLDDIGEKPWHQEGKQNAEWVLLDYVDVVAHVFYKDSREFYNIEGLWGDAEIEVISEDE